MVTRRQCRGVTLLELVISIVVVAIAAAALLGTMASVSKNSGDTLITQQAAAIANAYLEEALAKPFDDPDAVPTEASRATWDDVRDYDGLNESGAHDRVGNPIASLTQYQITMAVGPGTLGTPVGAVPAGSVLRVDVNVVHPSGVTVAAAGYRTRHRP